jgi:hypothetical protein
VIIPSRRRGLLAAIAGAAFVGGAIAALHYHRLGLTLSHYDARGHLVVARRVIDSITPGWQQIGAVWLPLPHLLNLLPVQIDALYRNGASAVALSVVAFAIATAAIAWIIVTLTDSALAATAGAAVFALNPNVLYLQATPMTEPLLLALTTVGVAILIADLKVRTTTDAMTTDATTTDATTDATTPGVLFALACLTRYEAWPVTACAVAAAVWARWRAGESWTAAWHRIAPVALCPAAAVLAFLVFSRIVVGQWFVSSGFFVPENTALGDPLLAAAEIWWGTHTLSGYLTIAISSAGLIALLVTGVMKRERAAGIITLSLLAAATLPWAAFVKGHPFRIRYVVPLVAAEAIGAGIAIGAVKRLRVMAALLVLGALAYDSRVLSLFSSDAPMAPVIIEAQWEQPNAPVRQTITRYLRANYDGTTIMASMGSLGHYMQEASRDGFAIREFLHEGNGDIWLAALDSPRPFVGWVLIEEKANGGDALARIARENPRFLVGFSRVCEGAGLALYRRDAVAQNRTPIVSR